MMDGKWSTCKTRPKQSLCYQIDPKVCPNDIRRMMSAHDVTIGKDPTSGDDANVTYTIKLRNQKVLVGRPGDYIVQLPDGEYRIYTEMVFRSKFEVVD